MAPPLKGPSTVSDDGALVPSARHQLPPVLPPLWPRGDARSPLPPRSPRGLYFKVDTPASQSAWPSHLVPGCSLSHGAWCLLSM